MNPLEIDFFIPQFLKNSATYYVIATDLAGNYRYVNQRFEDKFRFLEPDFIGKSSFIGIHPDDHHEIINAVKACLGNPEKVVQVFLRKPINNNLDHIWSQWEFSSIMDGNGDPIGILCIGHDITDSEKANQRAKDLAQRVDAILEEVSDGFLQLGIAFEIRRVNTKFEQMFALSRKEIIGRQVTDIFTSNLGHKVLKNLEESLFKKELAVFDDYFPYFQKWFSFTAYPSNEGLSVFIRDITEEKKRKVAFDFSENKLKAVFDSTLDINLLIGLNGEILNFNRKADEVSKRVNGYSLTLGGRIEDFLPKDSLDEFRENFPKALSGNRIEVEVVIHFQGLPNWFEVSFFPVVDSAEELMGVAMNIRNINDRKIAELKLKENQELLDAMYNSTSEAWTFFDPDFTIKFSNKEAQKINLSLFGKEAQIGDSILDFVVHTLRPEFEELCVEVLLGNKITIQRQYEEMWWEIVMEPVFDKLQSEIIGISHIIRDISVIKNKEEKILKQNEVLKEITWHQSHGLRSHVANILALCDLLNNYTAEFEKEREQFIDLIFGESKKLDLVIHKIVALASKEDLDYNQ